MLPDRSMAAPLRRRWLLGSLAVGICFLPAAGILYYRASAPAYAIVYQGETLGVMPDKSAATTLIDAFLTGMAAERGRSVMPAGTLAVVRVLRRIAAEPGDPVAIMAALRDRVDLLTTAWAVTVDGTPVVIMSTREDAEQVLSGILDAARGRSEARQGTKVTAVRFREQVGILETTTTLEGFYGVEEATRILLRGTDRMETYTVRRNDSLWSIATNHRMSVANLRRANPQIEDPSLIRPGDQLNLVVPDPHLTVEVKEVHTFIRQIPFARETILDPERWPHELHVRERGIPGREQVTVAIVRVNDEEQSRKILEVAPISEPVTQVIVRGSRRYPQLGTGNFVWPVGGDGGRLTSPFGRRWGGFHLGMDIAAPYGTPVLAADRGTVIDASFRGRWGYGWTVMIDHGGGTVVTLYAHLTSPLPVRVGQVVERGQIVGYVGLSGRTNGPHLHFEVRIDGRPVDPIGYYPLSANNSR